jgi:nucleoid-associated protein YgaU
LLLGQPSKWMNKRKLFAALPVLAALCFFSSCASVKPNEATPTAGAAPTDSQLLADSEKVATTDVGDAGVFADLDAAKKAEKSTPTAAAVAVAEGDTYYSSIGGETLRRVAVTLYSNKSFAKKLLAKNPDLKSRGKLAADQKVFFDMSATRPEPRYLTKDLLQRYAEPLAERLTSQAAAKGLAQTSATVSPGESLQDVSKRLYGTHRYWTEIYLVNHDKIKNYDRVPAGLTLSVIDRQASGVAKAALESPAAITRNFEPALKQVALPPPPPAMSPSSALIPPPIQAATHEAAVAPLPLDPIPETPAPPPSAAAKPAPMPLPVLKEPKSIPAAVPARIESREDASANSSLRRILYVVLILGIGGAAYYFTRTPKRPQSDMLDLNTEAGRPKLTPKDTQKSQIG